LIIPVADVGGQYNHLITRALTELGVESKLVPMFVTAKQLEEMHVDGFVTGGGPQRIGSEMEDLGNLPTVLKQLRIPILGICVTHQLLAAVFGGKAGSSKFPEYGPVRVFVDEEDEILKGFGSSFTAWESHNDEVLILPKNFKNLAHSERCNVQAMRHINRPIFGVQFHPEVVHTEKGHLIFKNFVEICKR